jgi:hypothetical protein
MLYPIVVSVHQRMTSHHYWLRFTTSGKGPWWPTFLRWGHYRHHTSEVIIRQWEFNQLAGTRRFRIHFGWKWRPRAPYIYGRLHRNNRKWYLLMIDSESSYLPPGPLFWSGLCYIDWLEGGAGIHHLMPTSNRSMPRPMSMFTRPTKERSSASSRVVERSIMLSWIVFTRQSGAFHGHSLLSTLISFNSAVAVNASAATDPLNALDYYLDVAAMAEE